VQDSPKSRAKTETGSSSEYEDDEYDTEETPRPDSKILDTQFLDSVNKISFRQENSVNEFKKIG
jgi:hypothetical protein